MGEKVWQANGRKESKQTKEAESEALKRRKKNAGKGFGMMFHGAFGSKEEAKKKERKVHGFIQPRNIKGQRRFVVMSERKNPIRRKKKKNPVIFDPDRGLYSSWQKTPGGTVYGTGKTAAQAMRDLHERVEEMKGKHVGRSAPGYFGNPMDLVVMGANPGRRRRRNQPPPVWEQMGEKEQEHIEERIEEGEEARRKAFEDAGLLPRYSSEKFHHEVAELGGHTTRVGWPNRRRNRGQELHVRPGQTITLRVNPEAAELREEFVGRESAHTFHADEPHMPKGDYAQLGKLVGITFKPEDRAQVDGVGWYEGAEKVSLHEAAKSLRKLLDAPTLVSDEDGRQLYLVGGNQDLSGMLEFVPNPRRNPDGLWELGEAQTIVYRERKSMNDFELINYEHKFGEENGEKPMLLYDEENERVILSGGDYEVKPEGIVN